MWNINGKLVPRWIPLNHWIILHRTSSKLLLFSKLSEFSLVVICVIVKMLIQRNVSIRRMYRIEFEADARGWNVLILNQINTQKKFNT